MTKEEFIVGYCLRSKISWKELSKWRQALPCFCGGDGCKGWAMVPLDLAADHMSLYGTPDESESEHEESEG